MNDKIKEHLCPTCGSPCVTSINEWVCLTPSCALQRIRELQEDKKSISFRMMQQRSDYQRMHDADQDALAAYSEAVREIASIPQLRLCMPLSDILNKLAMPHKGSEQRAYRAGQEAMRERVQAHFVSLQAQGIEDGGPGSWPSCYMGFDEIVENVRVLEVE